MQVSVRLLVSVVLEKKTLLFCHIITLVPPKKLCGEEWKRLQNHTINMTFYCKTSIPHVVLVCAVETESS